MVFDRFRKKTDRPPGGGSSPLETVDISGQVPEVDDLLAQIDRALNNAGTLKKRIEQEGITQDRCGC